MSAMDSARIGATPSTNQRYRSTPRPVTLASWPLYLRMGSVVTGAVLRPGTCSPRVTS
jgi:hypothetical protein